MWKVPFKKLSIVDHWNVSLHLFVHGDCPHDVVGHISSQKADRERFWLVFFIHTENLSIQVSQPWSLHVCYVFAETLLLFAWWKLPDT